MEYKCKKTRTPYTDKDCPAWDTTDFVHYYKDTYQRIFKTKTHKPTGLILAHINAKSINFLYNQIKSDEPSTDKNELYRAFIDWVFAKKRTRGDGLIRVWFLSNKEIMTDYLDIRAKDTVEAQLGSDEAFEKQEQERREKTRLYFENRKDTGDDARQEDF